MKRALLAAMLGALGFCACERVDVVTRHEQGTAPVSGLAAPGATLFQRVADSTERVRFQGTRRIELHFSEGTLQQHAVLRERVSADGQGRFAIETLDVLEPPLSAQARELFVALQYVREGMNWRYRDFAIHDLRLFLQNYRAVETGTTNVAGLECLQLEVERQDGSGSVHALAVHVPTGLVLLAREESIEGALISEMRFEQLTLAPNLEGIAWHQSANNEVPLPISGSVHAEVGYEPRSPRHLPPGYQLVERSRLLHPQDLTPWVKATYSDGVLNLFYLHGGPIVGGNGISSGAPEIQADLVEVYQAKPWIVAQGNLRGERVIAMGKVAQYELLNLVRSAME